MFRYGHRGRRDNQEAQFYRRQDMMFCEPVEEDGLVREIRHQKDTKDRRRSEIHSLTSSLHIYLKWD